MKHLTIQRASSRPEPDPRPLHAFISIQPAGAVLLLAAGVTAIVWTNSPWGDGYRRFWNAKLSVGFASFAHAMTVGQWVTDGLMVGFFLLIGLEIKRQLLFGELATLRQATLPIAAAIGGMVAPVQLYTALKASEIVAAGWAVPMATDIALAVGVLVLVGRSLPIPLKAYLLAVAIAGNLGAAFVIAVFSTKAVSTTPLLLAGMFLVSLALLNVWRVYRPLPYILLGIGLWCATLLSGVHATIAGVLLALTIPATREVDGRPHAGYVRRMLRDFESNGRRKPSSIAGAQSRALVAIVEASRAVQTPLARIEHALLKPVTFVIVPLFALANWGVDIRSISAASDSSVTWAVLLALLLGKSLGVLGASWVAVKLGIADLPEGTTWRQLAGASALCGIGFTISLFAASLAFADDADRLAAAKVGILAAALLAGVVGASMIATAGGTGKRSRTSSH